MLFGINEIAAVVHNVNRQIQSVNGEPVDPEFSELAQDDFRRKSTIDAVVRLIEHPDVTPVQEHTRWYNDRIAQGWSYGPTKDPGAKKNPALVPYSALPPLQVLKDMTRQAIVATLSK